MDFGAPLCGSELEPYLERIDVEKKAIVFGPASISPFSQTAVVMQSIKTSSFDHFVEKIDSMKDEIEEFFLYRIEAWPKSSPDPDDATPFDYVIRCGWIGSATWA